MVRGLGGTYGTPVGTSVGPPRHFAFPSAASSRAGVIDPRCEKSKNSRKQRKGSHPPSPHRRSPTLNQTCSPRDTECLSAAIINIDLAQTSAKLDDKKADETDTLAERPRSLQPPALQLCAPTTLQHCAPTTLQATNAARKQRQHYRQTITYKYVRD